MHIPESKKVYFLSDFHLGVPDYLSSLEREKRIVSFLDEIKDDAAVIFIIGDMFDFWYEYKRVVPKGYVRILGKLAELTDRNIRIYFFVGNHDMWMKGYFEKELNIPVHFEEKEFDFNGRKFLIGHGDGLGPGDHQYKFLKKIFRSRLGQVLFGMIHPDIGIGLANYFSRKSREKTGEKDRIFMGEDKEWLILYCREKLKEKHYDYFIFGHRHLPMTFDVGDHSLYINTGDWIKNNSYAVFDGTEVSLIYYSK